MGKYDPEVARNILRLRLSQMIINEKYKADRFKIPIHLALGHETIAVAVDLVMHDNDKLVLSHRNIHYNLARIRTLKEEIEEYCLSDKGLACGRQGSMNLSNPARGISYSSSILGNNFAVGSGLALGEKVNKTGGVVFIVTGDGAMEEGSFYESLLFQKSNDLAVVTIIENNQWSLATKINERRSEIDIKKIAHSLGAEYIKLKGNDPFGYIEKMKEVRALAADSKTAVCVEVELTTLGGWYVESKENPRGRFINYHGGPAPKVNLTDGPVLERSKNDPVYVLKDYFDEDLLKGCTGELLSFLHGDIK